MNILRDIPYGATPHPARVLDLYLPDAPARATLLCFHGGGLEGGDKEEYETACLHLAKRGIACVNANYRTYPEAKYPDFLCDSAEAVAWAQKNASSHGLSERIFIGGSSAGAYIAMMLCFDGRYLGAHGINPDGMAGYIFDAGQPTAHFNVLIERGLDGRRIVVDETAPLYFVRENTAIPRVLLIVSDNDMPGRYEQTLLLAATLKNFGNGENTALRVMENSAHCEYVRAVDSSGDSVLGSMVDDFISKL